MWGVPIVAVAIGLILIGVVSLRGELVNLPSVESRLWAVIGILVAVVSIIVLHAILLGFGVYALAGSVFRKEAGESTKAAKPLKRDARLQRVYEELRVSHGWLWRRRLRWLLVNGQDEHVDQVAPGLKQSGILHVGEVILVHASPDKIVADKWLNQIRQLRRRRPVDGIVHITDAQPDAELPRTLSSITTALGWAAPVTFLHPVEAMGSKPERFEPVGAFMPDASRREAHVASDTLPNLLYTLEQDTADAGIHMCTRQFGVTWLLEISEYVGERSGRIVEGVRALAASNWLRAPLAGVMFAPVFPGAPVVPTPVPDGDETQDESTPPANEKKEDTETIAVTREQPPALLPVWQKIAASTLDYRGRRTRLYWPNLLAACVMLGAIAWTVALLVSGIGNQALMRDAQTTANTALAAKPGTPQALRAQLALQKQIDTLEYRQRHGAPWYLRAGLSRNDELLDALWQPYQTVAARNLQQPIAQALETQLAALSQIRADEQQDHDAQQHAYNRLKAYLMLATPAHADASFLKAQLLEVLSAPADMRAGEWLDTSQQLAGFWTDHLKAHPGWRINASMPLIAQMRSTLVNQIGLAGSDDVLYDRVLEAARGKYADISLATLLAGADARGLFTTTQTVPGIFTRAAWEGVIERAIDDAAKEQHVEGDWVLTDPAAKGATTGAVESAENAAHSAVDAKREADDLRKRLRARYFTEYASAWASMLNSFRWVPATSFSAVIDQLTRLTDAQTSPLIAVMKSVQYQGEAGRPSQALSDTLVRKAKGMFGGDDSDQTQTPEANPLDRSFGPLLALLGDANPSIGNGKKGDPANAAAFSGVSLSRVLTADTTVRLKLQQIQSSPDAQSVARALAQAVFQGKLSDLTQARNDAALTAASLGAQWAAFGQAMFVQPLDIAWQAVLQPAAASLNDTWRASVAAPFQTLFASRYPFAPTSVDASFAEFGRYVRPDTGAITRFIEGELSGVLKRQGDQWVPNELAPQALQFDPKFLAMLKFIGQLGAHLYARGEASYHFEMMPQPTPEVTRNELTIDGQKIVYFNQLEQWTPLAWPGDGLSGHASLTWQTFDAGLRIAYDATGDWAFLRLLEKAQTKALDDTRYELVWNAGDNAKEPLHYLLRVQAGAGPLDLLKLRGFQMPERIFVAGRAGVLPAGVPSLPPLPPEMQP